LRNLGFFDGLNTALHRDMEPRTQVFSQFLGELFGVRREEVYVLRHARLVHISIDGLSAEHDRVVAAAQKLQHRILMVASGRDSRVINSRKVKTPASTMNDLCSTPANRR